MKCSFCGNTVLLTDSGGITECLIDIISCLCHGIFLLAAGPNFLFKWFKLQSLGGTENKKSWLRFPGHTLRWIISFALSYFLVMEMVESILTDYSSGIILLHGLVPNIIGLLALVFSLGLYDFAEANNLVKFLFVTFLYWTGVMSIRIMKIVIFYHKGMSCEHARVTLSWIIVVLVIFLVLIDIVVFLTQDKRCLNKHFKKSSLFPAEELSSITYLNPYTNFLNRLTFHWLTPLLIQGYHRVLEMTDLGTIPQVEHSRHNFEKMKQIFEEELAVCRTRGKGQPSLWRCYWYTYWPMMVLAGLFKLLADMLIFVPPMLLDHIVNFVAEVVENNEISPVHNTTNHTVNFVNGTSVVSLVQVVSNPLTIRQFMSNGYVLAFVILGAGLLQASFWQHHIYLTSRQGIRLKGALQALVFDKTLRLSSGSMSDGGISQGQVANHMAVDPMHLCMFFQFGHLSWTLPLQMLVTLCLLYRQLGVSALISASLVICLVPCQYLLARGLAGQQKKILEHADRRLKQSNELLQSIKLLKLYAWELVFCQNIENTRSQELRCLLKAAGFRVLSIAITDGTPFAATVIAFISYPFLEKTPLEAGKVFSSLALFNILGVPLFLVTMMISILAHAKTSTARLLPFLLAPEIETEQQANEAIKKVPHVQYSARNSTGSMYSPLLNNVNPDSDSVIENELESIDSCREHEVDSNVIQPLLSKTTEIPRIEITDENLEICQQDCDTEPDCSVSPKVTICISDFDDDCAKKEKNNVSWDCSSPESTPKSNEIGKTNTGSDCVVSIKNGSFSWDLDSKEIVLHNINISVLQGKLSMIVGSVGCGKSSLLSAVLGEMNTVSGKVKWKKGLNVAYGAQKAWLMNATLKDNILFGHKFDHDRYEKVVAACALPPDIAMLPGGDLTEIGEKGINLSGGQKQRVSIARALYSDADVVLLDDPMSALDVHVGSHIFREAVMDFLLREGRTVILVTHQLQYLCHAHKVFVMKEGCVTCQGSLEEISEQEPELFLTMKNTVGHAKKEVQKHSKMSPEQKDVSLEREVHDRHIFDHRGHRSFDVGLNEIMPLRSSLSIHSLNISLHDEEEPCTKEVIESRADRGKLIEEEERSTGAVSWKVYVAYVQAATVLFSFLAVFGYSTRQAVRVGTDFWLASWSEAARLAAEGKILNVYPAHNITSANETAASVGEGYDLYFYVHGFSYFCLAGLALGFTCIIFLECASLIAARNLHHGMLQCIVRAPMRFFDTTPVGRIINRMSGDTNTLDEKMPVAWDGFLFTFLFVLGGILVNVGSTPIFLIPAVPMFVLYLGLLKFYVASSRELQRLDNVTKSPILSHFSETLGGLATIRAYGDQQRFQEQNWKNIDANNTAFLYLHTANVWMGLRLDYLGIVIVFTAALCSITAGIYGQVSPGIVGLTVAYAILNTMFFSWLVHEMNHIVMYMTCTERVVEYASIPTEVFSPNEGVEPEKDWPSQGTIRFENVSLRYDASLDPVVHNLTLRITGGQKVSVFLCYDASLDPVVHNLTLHITGGQKVSVSMRYDASLDPVVHNLTLRITGGQKISQQKHKVFLASCRHTVH